MRKIMFLVIIVWFCSSGSSSDSEDSEIVVFELNQNVIFKDSLIVQCRRISEDKYILEIRYIKIRKDSLIGVLWGENFEFSEDTKFVFINDERYQVEDINPDTLKILVKKESF